MKPFKSKTPIQIRFRDLDSLNHVNSSVYFSYFELCRVEYFSIITPGKRAFRNTSFVVAKQKMEYKQQVVLEDKIVGSVWVSRVGGKSFDMEFSVYKIDDNNQEVQIARGGATFVCVDVKSMQTVLVPEEWKTAFYISE